MPQALAYAQLAQVDAVVGLYAAIGAAVGYVVLGGVRSMTVGPEATVALLTASVVAPMAAGDPARYLALGGCPKDRFIETPEGEPGLNDLCAGSKAFLHHVDQPMRIMSQLLRQDRAPSELVRWYAAQDARGGSAGNGPLRSGGAAR